MSTLDLDTLEAVARAATPGPWADDVLGSEGYAVIAETPNGGLRRLLVARCGHEDWDTEANVDHIATFDPPTILALIARAREADTLRAERDTHRETAEGMSGLWQAERDRADRLETMCDRLAGERVDREDAAESRAEAAESALAEARATIERFEALADNIEAGTAKFMADYEKAGEGVSTRMSGEAAAMYVAALAQVESDLRAALASPAATQPEGETRTEWGVRWDGDKYQVCRSRDHAERMAGLYGRTLIRRTLTAGPWVEAGEGLPTCLWTCERCGHTETVFADSAPSAWRRVTAVVQPAVRTATSPQYDADWCDACAVTYLAPIDVPERDA